jgi:hypothetical protein
MNPSRISHSMILASQAAMYIIHSQIQLILFIFDVHLYIYNVYDIWCTGVGVEAAERDVQLHKEPAAGGGRPERPALRPHERHGQR